MPGLNASVILDRLPQIYQGDNLLLNGTITLANRAYEVVSISAVLDYRDSPQWALETLQSSNLSDLYGELNERTAYAKDEQDSRLYGRMRKAISVEIPRPAASFFEGEKKRLKDCAHDACCDTEADNGELCTTTCTSGFRVDSIGRGGISENGSFSIWLNVSDLAAVTPLDTSIVRVTSRLSFVLGIRASGKDEEQDDERKSEVRQTTDREQEVHDVLNGWSLGRRPGLSRGGCRNALCKKKKRATFFLKQSISEVPILPKQWQKYDREADLDEGVCLPDELYRIVLGPKMLRWDHSAPEQQRVLSQQACQSDSSAFPFLSDLNKTILKSSAPFRDMNVGKISSTKIHFEQSHLDRLEQCYLDCKDDCSSPLGTCAFSTGELWAGMLLVQYNLRSSSERKIHSDDHVKPQADLRLQSM